MDWLDYREKLNIGFSDDQKFRYFITNIFSILNSFVDATDYGELSFSEYCNYCNLTGTSWDSRFFNDSFTYERYKHCLSVLELHTSFIEEFLAYYIPLMNALELNREYKMTRENYKNILVRKLDQAHIPYTLQSNDNEYFVVPKGAKELDDSLVSEPLEWLKNYPNAHKTFVIALKQYSDGEFIRDAADNLRKALEAFLQEFLGNNKNLETNKNEICKYLGSQSIDASVAGLFQPLINAYKNINDSLVKHNDAIDKKLLEFLLYQTGLLIRMVIVVKQSETEESSHAD